MGTCAFGLEACSRILREDLVGKSGAGLRFVLIAPVNADELLLLASSSLRQAFPSVFFSRFFRCFGWAAVLRGCTLVAENSQRMASLKNLTIYFSPAESRQIGSPRGAWMNQLLVEAL